jgi:uncharacterized membrane protein YphA (DoxX/SURF4 family)
VIRRRSPLVKFGVVPLLASRRGLRLSRLFHGFPGGRIGFGLLLLRAAVGGIVLFQGVLELTNGSDTSAADWLAGLLPIAIGVSLLSGLMTPVSGALTAVSATALAASVIPPPHPFLFGSKLCVAFVGAVALAIVFLGPGALSLDARLFGLREIIIPRTRTEE